MKSILIIILSCLMLSACDKTPSNTSIGSIFKEKSPSDISLEVVDSFLTYNFEKALSLSTEVPPNVKNAREAMLLFNGAIREKQRAIANGEKLTTMLDGKPYKLSVENEEITLGTKIINGVKEPDLAKVIVKADAGNGQGRFFKLKLANAGGEWRAYEFN